MCVASQQGPNPIYQKGNAKSSKINNAQVEMNQLASIWS
jgi:hypothetical protein